LNIRLHKFLLTSFLMLCGAELYAQAPVISYQNPQNLTTGNAANITPVTSGAIPTTPTYTVTTFAGNGLGNTNGSGTAALFNNPRGIAKDAAGNFYIADYSNNLIRKITPAAVVTTFAGSGSAALTDGTGTAAAFNGPSDITIDPSDNLYITDYGNDRIRKITPAGVVTTLATVTKPAGILYSSTTSGLFVSSYTNHTIVQVTLGGVASVFAGLSGFSGSTDGTGTAARFFNPYGISDDNTGNIYVADQGNNKIRKVTSAGVVTTFAGSGTAGSADGTGTAATFNFPSGITISNGIIYINDTQNNKIRMITASGVVTTIAGSGTAGAVNANGTAATFNGPYGLQTDASGSLFIADAANNRIRKIVPGGGFVINIALPTGLSFNTGTGQITGIPTVVTPLTNYTITAFNTSGSSTTILQLATTAAPAVTGTTTGCGAGSVTLTANNGANPTGGTYTWYNSATSTVAIATTAAFNPIVSGTYYVAYTLNGTTSARTAATATIYPKVSSPISNASIAYSFSGDTRDVSQNQNNGILQNTPTLIADRYGIPSSAYNFTGTNQWITTTKLVTDPQTFTISAWFNTTTTTGGRIVGFSGGQDGGGQFDRHIYMNDAGQLYFGVYSGSAHTINTAETYNNGQWHHVIATLSVTNGMRLYVDNVLIVSNTTYNAAEPHDGYWNIGGVSLLNWPSAPTSAYFKGVIDDVSILTTELSTTAATTLSTNDLNIIGAYAPVCVGSPITLYSPTITGATYTWTDPNGLVVASTTPSATFPAAVAGSYNLSVTGGPGGCSSTATYTPTVYALPTAAVITAPASSTTGTATAVSVTATAGITYTWTAPGGTLSSATGNSITITWTTGGIKTVTVTATNANGCTAASSQTILVTATINASNYAFSHPVTLNTSAIPGGLAAPLTNFPALVYIKEDALKTTGVNCSNNVNFPTGGTTGYDFAFTLNGSTNELFYQVESYDATTGTLLVWVQIPSLSATNTALNFYFGSLTPGHPASFTRATWSNDYQTVYHFNEGSGTIIDATINQKTATATNATVATGKISAAYTFNGTSTKVVSTGNVDATSTFTLSAWTYVNSFTTDADQKIITNQPNYTSGGYKLGYYGGSATTVKAEVETRTGGTATLNRATTGGNIVSTGAWHYVQGVYNGTNFITYYDGVADRTSAGAAAAAGGPLYVGSDFASTHYFNGIIDEVRVSNVAKSADWIKAEYYNQNNYTTFTTSGTTFTTNATAAKAIGGSLIYTWTGTGGTATGTATNWTTPASGNPTGLPTTDGTASLKIPNTTNKPVLAAPLSVYGVTIDAGSNFNLNGNTLTVGCNVYNSGTITGTTSDIIWTGSYTPQLYTGNTTTTNSAQFANFTVNNTASNGQVKITGGPINLYNTLTLTNGSLVVDNVGNGALTLKSSGTITARVAEITSTSNTITGNVTVERWFTGGATTNRGWRLMSSPVNNTSTVPASTSAMYNFTSLKTNLNITGSGTNFDASANNGPTILFYNTATKLFTWPTDPTTTNRNIGSGFYFFYRGSRTGNNKLVKSGSAYPAPEPDVVGLQTGALNQQAFTYTLSNANAGFNQVGNPYPSSILMPSGSTNTTLTGTTNFVYTYVSNANSITSQPSAVVIASGQGFYVKSNSATSSVNFTESLKTASQPTGSNLLLGTPMGTEVPIISLKMVQDSANYDIAHLRYLDTYKNEYNEMEDADDLNGPNQNVFFGAMTTDDHLVAIASQPFGEKSSSVFLSVNDNFSGTYSIEKTNLAGIPDVYDVWLMDHFKNDSLDLRANSVYKFNLDKANPQTFGKSRFEVVVRKKNLPPYKLISFTGKKEADNVLIKWNTINEYTYTAFELQKSTDGQNFEAVKNMQSASQGIYTFKDIYNDKGVADIYYRLKQTDINNNVTYSDIIIISTRGDGTLNIFPNPATNVIQYRLNVDFKGKIRLKIYSAMGILMKNSIFVTTAGEQDISSLTPGTYTIELTDNNSKKALLTGKFIKL
jgi:hypothetical protein